MLLDAGVWAEAVPELRETALETYRRAAALEWKAGDATGLAGRNLARLESLRDIRFSPDPQSLAQHLARALRAKDARILAELASPTHFSLGIGCHRIFTEAEPLLGDIAAALKGSSPRFDPFALRVHGGKAYLRTEGWNGAKIRGGVTFLLSSSPHGWQFGGINLEMPNLPEFELPTLPPIDLPDGLLDPVPLKAPWPSGDCFTAGGLAQYTFDQSAILSLFLPCATGNPIACIAGAASALILLEAHALQPCGFGPRGFFYDFNTHQGRDRFAIDFTRYKRGVPFRNISEGTPVLAAAPGIVTRIVDNISSGDTVTANRVSLRHTLGITTLASAFESEYLHLAGPNLCPSPSACSRHKAAASAKWTTPASPL